MNSSRGLSLAVLPLLVAASSVILLLPSIFRPYIRATPKDISARLPGAMRASMEYTMAQYGKETLL